MKRNEFYKKEAKKHINLITDKKDNFFEGDKGNGRYGDKQLLWILQDGYKNLYREIRKPVKQYMEKNQIKWWGDEDEPSGHTLSSQIACLNHLFAIKNDDKAVLAMLNGVRDEYDKVLPIPYDDEKDRGYIAFEVVSKEDLLREGTPTRGANNTSIDAFVYAHHQPTNKNHIILIEWKYTETYEDEDKSNKDRIKGAVGTNGKGHERMSRYNDTIFLSTYLNEPKGNKYQGSVYYQEPFYQLMRQTLWAEQVVKHRKSKNNIQKKEPIDAFDYLHIHVVPSGNKDLLCKGFPNVGDTMEETWKEMLTDKGKERYIIIDPEKLLDPLADSKEFPEYEDLIRYLEKRYWE